MKIACIGWGSLIWNPGNLKVQNKWFEDGPLLPIEFIRISDDKRVTLVIDKMSKPVRTLWSLMTIYNLEDAIISLKEREGTKGDKIHSVKSDFIGDDKIKVIINEWIKSKRLDAAIWTGLD